MFSFQRDMVAAATTGGEGLEIWGRWRGRDEVVWGVLHFERERVSIYFYFLFMKVGRKETGDKAVLLLGKIGSVPLKDGHCYTVHGSVLVFPLIF